jgi:hypothetical protein
MAGEQGATQPGVQEREGGHVDESKERPLTPREEALAAIASKRRDAISDEMVEAGMDPLPDRDEPAPKPKPAPVAAKKDDEQLDDAATQLDKQSHGMRFDGDPSKTLVTVKIDGDEITLPLDKVLANYQKSGAAEKRLEEATRLRDDARRAATAPAPGPAPAPAAADAPAPAEPEPKKPKTDPRAFSSALFEGDEDKAAAAFEAAVAERVDAAIERMKAEGGAGAATPEAIRAAVAEARQQEVVAAVLQESQAAYPKLYSSRVFQAEAADRIERRMAEGVAWADALGEVSSQMADEFGWKKQGQPAPKPGDRQRNERLEARKAGIDRLPTASARRPGDSDTPPPMDELERAGRGIEFLRKTRPSQSGEVGG